MSRLADTGWDYLDYRFDAFDIWWERTRRLLGPTGYGLYIATVESPHGRLWRFRRIKCEWRDLWSQSYSVPEYFELPVRGPVPPMFVYGKYGHVR